MARLIDADKLLEIFKGVAEQDKYTAVFVAEIIRIINNQPTVSLEAAPSEIVIDCMAWNEMPVEAKAAFLKAVRGTALTITGYRAKGIEDGKC